MGINKEVDRLKTKVFNFHKCLWLPLEEVVIAPKTIPRLKSSRDICEASLKYITQMF